MSDNEKLIEEARRAKTAVYLATEASVADDLSRIIGGLADALEAATKAHTPTDDELIEIQREAIEEAMHIAGERDGFASSGSRESIVAGLRAVAGFRRPEVPESSVMRRIQAEATRRASRELEYWINNGGPTPGTAFLDRLADRIEGGE